MTGRFDRYAFPVSVAAAIAAAAVLLDALTHQGLYAGFNWDDAWYLLLADRLAGRLGDVPSLARELTTTRSYPPLYPAWLALFGGGADAIAAAFRANLAAYLGAAGAFAWWLRREGIDRVVAAMLVVAMLLAPFAFRHVVDLWSETLFIALAMVALGAAAPRDAGPGSLGLAAAACALAFLARTAGVALVVAFVAMIAYRRPRHAWMLLAVAILPCVAERLLAGGGGYAAAGQGLFAGLQHLPELGRALWAGWSANLAFEPIAPGERALAGIVLLLALPALAMRLRRMALDACFVVAYIALVAAYGFWEHATRFLFPLMPIALFHAACTLARIPRSTVAVQRTAGAALVALLALPTALRIAERSHEAPHPDLHAFTKTSVWWLVEPAESVVPAVLLRYGLVTDMAAVERIVPPDACVATEFPPVVMLHARRRAEVPPWRRVEDADGAGGTCRFYYYIPSLVPEASDPEAARAALERAFETRHVSPIVPWAGAPPAGILLERRAMAPDA